MRGTRKNRFLSNLDWISISIWFVLCIIGWFNIRAAVYDPAHPSLLNIETNYGKQAVYILSATVLAFFILIIDFRFFISISPVAYLITAILLVLVLIVGRSVGGNQAWIPLGSFRLQPAEFSKFATCLLLAYYMSEQAIRHVPGTKQLIIASLIILFPIALIMLQPDAGSALTFSALIFVLYREGYVGTPLLAFGALAIALFVLALLINHWVLIGILAAVGGLIFYFMRKRRKNIIQLSLVFVLSSLYIFSVEFAYNDILQSHQRNRIDVILGKIDDPRGEGYNLNQSKIAIGSGQLFGKGYLQGTQTKFKFVPEQSTDFIFCTIGEEWGFIGSIVLISLYITLLMRLIHLAERQRLAFARIYGYGVISILFFHFFINIGMTIGIIPVIGIPLPFISYGGSALWSFTILLFIFLKFDSSRKGLNG